MERFNGDHLQLRRDCKLETLLFRAGVPLLFVWLLVSHFTTGAAIARDAEHRSDLAMAAYPVAETLLGARKSTSLPT